MDNIMHIAILVFIAVFMIAPLGAFVILLAKKWKITEYIQVHAPILLSKLAGCDLCMSFWIGVIISIPLAVFTGQYEIIAAPIITTPITRIML